MRIVLLIGFLLTCVYCKSQKLPKIEAKDRVIFQKDDTLFQFYTCKLPPKFKIHSDIFYNWYINDTILITQGGIGGKLLHGVFQKFYPNNNLMEQGNFFYGQKNGTWKQWSDAGKLKSIINWKNSFKEGPFLQYDAQGHTVKEGFFKDDKLNGVVTEYLKDGKTRETFYDHGTIVEDTKQPPALKDSTGVKSKQ